MVTSSVTLDSPSMTLSETRIDKFCQSPPIRVHPSNRLSDAATPILGTLAFAFLASTCACFFRRAWQPCGGVRFASRRAYAGCGQISGPGIEIDLRSGRYSRPFSLPFDNRALLPGEERLHCFLRLGKIWREAGHALRNRRGLVQSSRLPQSLRQDRKSVV